MESIIKIKNMFKKSEKASEILSRSSENTLSVFKSTISSLLGIIEKTKAAIADKQTEIDAALAEKEKLEELEKENSKIVEKLSSIFN